MFLEESLDPGPVAGVLVEVHQMFPVIRILRLQFEELFVLLRVEFLLPLLPEDVGKVLDRRLLLGILPHDGLEGGDGRLEILDLVVAGPEEVPHIKVGGVDLTAAAESRDGVGVLLEFEVLHSRDPEAVERVLGREIDHPHGILPGLSDRRPFRYNGYDR